MEYVKMLNFYCLVLATLNTTTPEKVLGISPDILISSGVTIFVTILGFVVTFFASRKNLANEILKFKQTSQVDQVKDLAYRLCDLMYQMKEPKKNNQEIIDNYAEIMNKVIAYASSDAVNISIWGQQINFQNCISGKSSFAPLVALALLISQLKYDASAEIIPADTWFRLRINDYEKSGMKSEIEKLITETVEELNLNKGFCPKQK